MTQDDKKYVIDKYGFIYDLVDDHDDIVTVLTESGKLIDIDKNGVKILDEMELADYLITTHTY